MTKIEYSKTHQGKTHILHATVENRHGANDIKEYYEGRGDSVLIVEFGKTYAVYRYSVIEKMKDLIAETIGHDCEIVHMEGHYQDYVGSKASTSWGWKQPTEFNGYLIALARYSPSHKGQKPVCHFDFIEKSEESNGCYSIKPKIKLSDIVNLDDLTEPLNIERPDDKGRSVEEGYLGHVRCRDCGSLWQPNKVVADHNLPKKYEQTEYCPQCNGTEIVGATVEDVMIIAIENGISLIAYGEKSVLGFMPRPKEN